jgi:hypothetical protein
MRARVRLVVITYGRKLKDKALSGNENPATVSKLKLVGTR